MVFVTSKQLREGTWRVSNSSWSLVEWYLNAVKAISRSVRLFIWWEYSFQARQEKVVENRPDNSWDSYWSVKHLMKGDLLSNHLNVNSWIWSLTEAQKFKLGDYQRAMKCTILRVQLRDDLDSFLMQPKTGTYGSREGGRCPALGYSGIIIEGLNGKKRTRDTYWIRCSECTAHKHFNDPILYTYNLRHTNENNKKKRGKSFFLYQLFRVE